MTEVHKCSEYGFQSDWRLTPTSRAKRGSLGSPEHETMDGCTPMLPILPIYIRPEPCCHGSAKNRKPNHDKLLNRKLNRHSHSPWPRGARLFTQILIQSLDVFCWLYLIFVYIRYCTCSISNSLIANYMWIGVGDSQEMLMLKLIETSIGLWKLVCCCMQGQRNHANFMQDVGKWKICTACKMIEHSLRKHKFSEKKYWGLV